MATHGILLTMTVHTSYWKDIQTQIKNDTFSTEKVNASSQKMTCHVSSPSQAPCMLTNPSLQLHLLSTQTEFTGQSLSTHLASMK